MLKFVTFVLKNIGRNGIRSTLTSFAIIILTLIFTIVTTVTIRARELVNKQAGDSKLIVSERWTIPSKIPIRSVDEIVTFDEIVDFTTWNFYAGFFDDSGRKDRMALGIATRLDNLKSMHEDLRDVPDETIERLREAKAGALVGEAIVNTMHWQPGDEFTLLSTTHPGTNLKFKIVDVLPGATWSRVILFDRDYLMNSTGEEFINSILLRVKGPEDGQRASEEIAQRFRDRELQLKVETEAAGIARVVGRSQALLSIIDLVVAVLLFDMVIVLGNSIGIAVRERQKEFAVLKVLGFGPMHIFGFVISEAGLIGGVSGFLGAGIGYLLSEQTAAGNIPVTDATSFLLTFPVSSSCLIWGTLVGIFTGIASSIAPAWNAQRIRVVDVFSRV